MRMLSDDELEFAAGGQGDGNSEGTDTKLMYCPCCSKDENDKKEVQILLGGQGKCTNCDHMFYDL